MLSNVISSNFLSLVLIAVPVPSKLTDDISIIPGYEIPPCNPALPSPRYIVVLPNGDEIGASRLNYVLEDWRIEIVGDKTIFCGGFESV